MFESLKSVETLEKNLRKWHVEDAVRCLGESSRPECVRHADSLTLNELVEEVATCTRFELKDSEFRLRMIGGAPKVLDHAHNAKGLRLARAIAKAKGWRLQLDAEGYYKVE